MVFSIGEVEVVNEVSLAPSASLYDGATVADGDLTVKVNYFYYDLGGNHGKYAGSCGNIVTDNNTSYVYLDSSANLIITTSGYPIDLYIPLARVIASGGFITRIILERALLGSTANILSFAAPVNVTKSSADAGVALTSSRSDHKHDITTDIGASWTIGSSGAEGSSNALSRADHTHSVASPSAPENVTKAAASAGSSENAARADHKHDISVSAPIAISIGDTASEGTSVNLARADHKHSVSAGVPVDIGTSNAAGSALTHSRSDHVHDLPFIPVQSALSAATGDISFNSQNITNVASINGTTYYAPSATNPTVPPPNNSDQYYNTAIHEEMAYDGTRAKWLSFAQITLLSGAAGNTVAGSFFRGTDGLAYGVNIGHPVSKGTIVGILISMTTSITSDIEIIIDDTVIATFPITTSGITSDLTLNADFNEGLMKFRNKSTGGTLVNVQITALLKRRI